MASAENCGNEMETVRGDRSVKSPPQPATHFSGGTQDGGGRLPLLASETNAMVGFRS